MISGSASVAVSAIRGKSSGATAAANTTGDHIDMISDATKSTTIASEPKQPSITVGFDSVAN